MQLMNKNIFLRDKIKEEAIQNVKNNKIEPQ